MLLLSMRRQIVFYANTLMDIYKYRMATPTLSLTLAELWWTEGEHSEMVIVLT